MVRLRELPNREFKDWNEAHAALKENESRLVSLKCAQVYKSVDKLESFGVLPFLDKGFEASKAATPDWVKDGNVYPVINTTKYYDSHGDVHFDGIWKRSLKANVGKLHYLESHSMKIADIIAWPEDVKSFTKMVPWTVLGKNYSGETEALIYEISMAKIVHDGARKVINEKRDMQNSVRMQYVKMSLALNSDSTEWKENKELYDSRIDSIANKDVVENFGYFWAVDEAKIFKEGSMVIAGSNDATPNIYGKEGSANGTSSESSKDTRAAEKLRRDNAFYNNLI